MGINTVGIHDCIHSQNSNTLLLLFAEDFYGIC